MTLSFLCLIFSNIFVAHSLCAFNITATNETPKRYKTDEIEAPDCDDSAIIINKENQSQSLIVGTLKRAGLELYSLNGTLLQSIPAPKSPNNNSTNAHGRFNNVAVIKNIHNASKSIVIVSDRDFDQLRFYSLNAKGLLDDVTNASVPWIFSASQQIVNKQETAYGLTATNYNNSMTVFVSKRHQNVIAKVKILQIGNFYSYKVENMFTLPVTFANGWTPCIDGGIEADYENAQIEGMVVDEQDGTLLIAQEIVGLYRISIDGMGNDNFTLIDMVKTFGVEYERPYVFDYNDECGGSTNECGEYECVYNESQYGKYGGHIVADAEGISLYEGDGNTGYYVLSSQGSNEFNVYSRSSFEFIASFQIFYGDDMVQNTDGVEIKNGIMVVQDEGNENETNFKIVRFDDVVNAIQECNNDNFETTGPTFNTTMLPTDDGDGDGDGWATVFYSTMVSQNDKSDENEKNERRDEEERMNFILLGVLGFLLIIAFGMCAYFQFCNFKRLQKMPQNYVELQSK